MTNQFFRKVLPIIHKNIGKEMYGQPVRFIFENADYIGEYSSVTGKIMEIYALSDEQMDYVMGVMYVNLRDTPEEYGTIENFKKPVSSTYHIDSDEIWIARQTYSYKVDGYFPTMAGVKVEDDVVGDHFAEDVEWISHEETSLDFKGEV